MCLDGGIDLFRAARKFSEVEILKVTPRSLPADSEWKRGKSEVVHLVAKRPSCALEELRYVTAARTERRLYDQVDYCRRIDSAPKHTALYRARSIIATELVLSIDTTVIFTSRSKSIKISPTCHHEALAAGWR